MYAIECESLLLTKALNLFLEGQVTSLEQASTVISDTMRHYTKPVFRIGKSGLVIPFTKNHLYRALDRFEEAEQSRRVVYEMSLTTSTLDDKIEEIIRRFSTELIQTLKAHYEK